MKFYERPIKGPAELDKENSNLLRMCKGLLQNCYGGLDYFTAECPRHRIKSVCLGVGAGPDGLPILHCARGCSAKDVWTHLGFDFDHLAEQLPQWWRTPDVPAPRHRRWR